jgi:hypothetical protein
LRDSEKRQNPWPSRFFFAAVALFMSGAVLYFIFGIHDPAYDRRLPPIPPPKALEKKSLSPGDHLLLPLDQEYLLPKLKLVYRGMKDENLRIDCYLLELDPHTPYIHRLFPEQARMEFRMAGHAFRLVSMKESQIKIEVIW